MSTVPEEQLPATTEQSTPSAELTVLQGRQDLWKQAQAMSQSALVPAHFRNKPGDCFIMADLACRLGTPLLPTLQETYVVHGKPGFTGKFTAALLEGSGKIAGPIDYEFSGEGDAYGCRAVVHDRALNRVIHGPKVDWKMVKAERWDQKEGSKWKTLPELMFHYRAAAFLVRTRYPSVLMGMNTVDELEDSTNGQSVNTIPPQSKADVLAAELSQAAVTHEAGPNRANEDRIHTDSIGPGGDLLSEIIGQRQEEYKQAIVQATTHEQVRQVNLSLDNESARHGPQLSPQQIAGFRRSITSKAKKLGLADELQA